jgi:hypothetical protein
MLARYTIYRVPPKGKKMSLPDGIRQDTRWRCKRHPLRPAEAMVGNSGHSLLDKLW